jgi:hypothetical protein
MRLSILISSQSYQRCKGNVGVGQFAIGAVCLTRAQRVRTRAWLRIGDVDVDLVAIINLRWAFTWVGIFS